MEPASTSVMFANVVQNQHVRRVLNFLRSTTVTQQKNTAQEAERDETANSQATPLGSASLADGLDSCDDQFCLSTEEARNSAVDDDLTHQYSTAEVRDDPMENADEAGEDEQRAFGWDATLEEEADEDYTTGACRLRAVPEGDSFSIALMLKRDLSTRIKRAVEAQRISRQSQAHAELQIEHIESFEATLRDVINDKDYNLSKILEEQDAGDGGVVHAESDTVASLHHELDILQHVLEDMTTKKKTIGYRLRGYADQLQSRQAEVMEYLAAAFVDGLMIYPEVDDTQSIEVLDLDNEYREMAIAMNEGNDFGTRYEPEPLSIAEHQIQTKDISSRTPEQLARVELETAVWEARAARNDAERFFDSRGDRRDREWQEHRVAEYNGLPTRDASQEEFDLRWVSEDRLATRALIEAEENLAEAKAAAADGGVEVVDPEGDIPDYAYEFPGHPLSGEKEVGIIIPNPGVEAWRDNVAESADLNRDHEDDAESIGCAVRLDYWNFRDVEMGDSNSCVDWECYTEDIAKWQKACTVPRVHRSNSV